MGEAEGGGGFWAWLKKEFVERVWVSYGTSILGAVAVTAGLFMEDLQKYVAALDEPWAKPVAMVIGFVLIIWKQTTSVAKAKAAGKIAAVLLLLTASPAYAVDGFLVHCFSGCPDAKKKALGEGDTPLSSTVWVGPSVGFSAAVMDSSTHTWSNGFKPMFGYGVGFRPVGWTTTKALAKLDLFLSADFTASYVDVLPVVTLIDAIAIGFGPRVHFTTPTTSSSVSWLFALGIATSFGGP